MNRISTCLFLLASLCLSIVAQVALEPQMLFSGQSVERELAGDQSHTYQTPLTAGQFVRFRLTQRAIDAALILTAPDGKQLAEMDLTGSGVQEALFLEAAATGSYRLVVRGSGGATVRGDYRLEMTVQSTATVLDRQRVTAQSLLLEATLLRNQGAKTAEQVIEKMQQARSLLGEMGEPGWTAYSFDLTGTAYAALSQYAKAIDYFEQALALNREVKDRASEGITLFNLGNSNLKLYRYEKTLTSYEQALAIFREVKDRVSEGIALYQMGDVQRALNRNEQALTSYEQARAIYREMKNHVQEVNALNNLGIVSINLGRYQKAIEYAEQALAVAREAKNRAYEGYMLLNLGNNTMFLNRFDKAIEYYEQGLLIFREMKERVGEGRAFTRLGIAYRVLGRYEKALEYSEQTLPISRETKNRREEGNTLNHLGDAQSALSRYDKAIEYYEQALAISREVKDQDGEGSALNNLGRAYESLNRYEKAIEYYEQALAISRELKHRAGEGIVYSNLGFAYFRLGRYEKAIAYHEQALAISREVKDRTGEATRLYKTAQAERAQGNLLAARTHIEQSLKIAESIRSGEISTPESRASFLASFQDSYRLYTDLLMRQHQAEPTNGFDALAVEASERQRARSLLDRLTEASVDVRQGVDAALIERERSLGKQLNDKAQRLLQANQPEQVAALKQEISQLETDYERAQADIRKANPHLATLTQPQPLKLKEIQSQLDADTLLLEYALGEERSFLFAITKETLTSFALPKGKLIEKDARQLHELLSARSTTKRGESAWQRQERITQAEAQLPAATQQLSQTLLAPVAQQLGNKRLVIVADGALQYIPFAMLADPLVVSRPSSVAKNNGQPLIVNHEVISLSSASALAIQRTELAGRQPAPKLLAVMADPVFDRTDARFTTPATETSDKMQAPTIAFNDARSIEHLADKSADKEGDKVGDKSGVTTRRLVIPRLPFTRQEATRLLALAPKTSSFAAMDFQASNATVLKGDLAQYRYVHFATHGLVDTERPGLSSLVLSMVDAQGKPQDGFLRLKDIYNLKLPADLVVLSACQTGLGKEIKGEGMEVLTRGFMFAGAARVVVSLWSVNDRATAELMTKFYEKMLKAGERPAAALRAAQVEMWRQKQWQSPYYWAAFVMQGEWK
ncbi:MAG: tetratricopeptide repeat protein [Blastocatellia bacterium]|nr:tetratricopeptide repeat protein [Blastocatellia bacterium]